MSDIGPPAEPGTVIDVLDLLETMLAEARRLPFSASVVVNEDEVMELVDRARLSLPDELVQARHLIDDRERLLASAEEEARRLLERADAEARRLVETASAHAEHLVAGHTVLTTAQERADVLVREAEERAEHVTSEADAYAREVMGKLEEQLVRATTTVRKGLQALPPAPARRRRG